VVLIVASYCTSPKLADELAQSTSINAIVHKFCKLADELAQSSSIKAIVHTSGSSINLLMLQNSKAVLCADLGLPAVGKSKELMLCGDRKNIGYILQFSKTSCL